MTASPGVGDSKDANEAKVAILELMGNLDVTITPSRVRTHLADLDEHLNRAMISRYPALMKYTIQTLILSER